MRIVVVGAGGVGGLLGGRLAAAGHQVIFLARGRNLQTLHQQATIRLQSPDSDELIRPVDAIEDPGAIGPVDVVIVAVKAWQVSEVAESLLPLLSTGTVVLTLQNGVEAPHQLAKALGDQHVLGGVCVVIAYRVEPGHIYHVGGQPSIELGSLTESTEAITGTTRQLQDALSQAEVQCLTSTDINTSLWRKLLLISSYGGVGAITGAPVGITRKLPETRRMIKTAMAEVVEVAHAHGVALGSGDIDPMMRQVDAFHPESTASMQRDIAAKNPSELEYQTGAVVRLAEGAGLDVPTHRFIHACLLPSELRTRAVLDY